MTVRTAQVSREDQEETARMEADVSVTAIMTPEIRARDAEMTVRDHPAEEIRKPYGRRFRSDGKPITKESRNRNDRGKKRPSG